MKKDSPVMIHPVTNRGFKICAPTSEMYAMLPSWETYFGLPCASQVTSIASRVPRRKERAHPKTKTMISMRIANEKKLNGKIK